MTNKDWSGNSNSIYVTLGASNHTSEARQKDDFYATDPIAAEVLLQEEEFNKSIWECACGKKHLSDVFQKHGYSIRSSDIYDRCGNEIFDFLSDKNQKWDGDIITNPPYKYALEFIYKALSIIPVGNKVAMFLKVQFMEGKRRKMLFTEYPPKVIYVSSSRILCAKNAEFEKMKESGGSAVAYAWYIWQKGYTEDSHLKWIN